MAELIAHEKILLSPDEEEGFLNPTAWAIIRTNEELNLELIFREFKEVKSFGVKMSPKEAKRLAGYLNLHVKAAERKAATQKVATAEEEVKHA
jgi:hypothetical protein